MNYEDLVGKTIRKVYPYGLNGIEGLSAILFTDNTILYLNIGATENDHSVLCGSMDESCKFDRE